ncbi:SprT-like domain-containing protein [Psittacicella gerlachiana]|uniref:SprT-like domain-containing protein n=1 Tax=Psittacicella gerlachiana TaxID=2028574 RepID=UPI001CA70781|nr:SprT-like domain-containing protein [Psittacicella gerlachiana]
MLSIPDKLSLTPEVEQRLKLAQSLGNKKFLQFVINACLNLQLKEQKLLKSKKNPELSLRKLLSTYTTQKIANAGQVSPSLLSLWMQKTIKECLKIYNLCLEIFNFDSKFAFPQIEFHYHTSRGLAWYHHGKHAISFNLFTIISEKDTFLTEVVPHEFAHAVLCFLYQKKLISNKIASGHGNAFKVVAMLLGSSGKTTYCTLQHQELEQVLNGVSEEEYQALVSLAPKKRPEYLYTCNCPQKVHRLKIVRHKRQQQNPHYYHCTKCKGWLNFTGQTQVPQLPPRINKEQHEE